MSPVLFISLPFILLFLMSKGAGAHQPAKAKSKAKSTQTSDFQDGDIIIIRKQSKKQS